MIFDALSLMFYLSVASRTLVRGIFKFILPCKYLRDSYFRNHKGKINVFCEFVRNSFFLVNYVYVLTLSDIIAYETSY